MTKTAKQTKALTQTEAKARVLLITEKLLEHNLQFTFIIKELLFNENSFDNFYFKHEYKFIAVKDCDNVKFFIPEFEIKQDVYKKRYAELVIRYE